MEIAHFLFFLRLCGSRFGKGPWQPLLGRLVSLETRGRVRAGGRKLF